MARWARSIGSGVRVTTYWAFASSNAASIRLHAKFGFRHVGVLQGVGCKFGRWIDTVIMQRTLYAGDQT